MNNRELKKIIKRIQQSEGYNLTQIATESGIGRSHLSTLINDEEVKEVESPLIGKLSKKYPAYFSEQHQTDENKIDQILANLKEIQEYAITLITGQTAGHEVIMGALDRLEKNPEGSLSEAADRLALKIVERLNAIQTGKKAGAHKSRI
jgi:transcriptional regulator with XRE-family HTH domain